MDGSNNAALLRLLVMQQIFEAEDVEKGLPTRRKQLYKKLVQLY